MPGTTFPSRSGCEPSMPVSRTATLADPLTLDLTEDVVPADLRQRPLVAVRGVVRRAACLACAVGLDARHARVRAEPVDRGLQVRAAGEQDAVDAERSDVAQVLGSGRSEDLRLRLGRGPGREADEVRLGRRAESRGDGLEGRRRAPVGRIRGRRRELGDQAVRKIEGVGDRPVRGNGDVRGVIPRVVRVVVHRQVDGVAGLPVRAGQRDRRAGRVLLLVAVEGRCSRRRRRRRSRSGDGEGRARGSGGGGGRDRELSCDVGEVEGVRDRAVGGCGELGLMGPGVVLVVVHEDLDGLAGLPACARERHGVARRVVGTVTRDRRLIGARDDSRGDQSCSSERS